MNAKHDNGTDGVLLTLNNSGFVELDELVRQGKEGLWHSIPFLRSED